MCERSEEEDEHSRICDEGRRGHLRESGRTKDVWRSEVAGQGEMVLKGLLRGGCSHRARGRIVTMAAGTMSLLLLLYNKYFTVLIHY